MKRKSEPEVVLHTVPEAAHLLNVSVNTAWMLVRTNAIPSIRLGHSVRVPRAELLAHIAALAAQKAV